LSLFAETLDARSKPSMVPYWPWAKALPPRELREVPIRP
jgi:hypothetical protein